jgi:hypothetical protein
VLLTNDKKNDPRLMDYDAIVIAQKDLCEKYNNVEWVEASPLKRVGITKDIRIAGMPTNGLRHPPDRDMSGWYLWSSEGFPAQKEAFESMHIEHLDTYFPRVLKYLGLPPGWRFLFDDKGYEDVWFDKSLLDV